ncbi:MAG: MBL fold metallo-hydrolase [Planctomycetes bacterium]|nr:MBL fold metallo-hydrolase [Planctomycetota bacterium]
MMASDAMSIQVTATGNAGFHVAAGGASVFIDAFWDPPPRLLGGVRPAPAGHLAEDLILVTHAHWDHFSPGRVAEEAARTGAAVAGPAEVIRRLRGRLPDARLVTLEPSERPRGQAAAAVTFERPPVTVTAFRTSHGPGHNSYLVRMPGCRLFHDGDNEDTRLLDVRFLAPVDVLLLCPWQGSGWPEFVERLSPRRWLLCHLTEEEIALHRAGRFLLDLCERVPLADRTLALEAGETFTFEEGQA